MMFPASSTQNGIWVVENYRVHGVWHTVRICQIFEGLPWLVVLESPRQRLQVALSYHPAEQVQAMLAN